MIEINTFISKCTETTFPQIEQLVSDEYFNIKDKIEFAKCKKFFKSESTIYISGYIEIIYFGQTYIGKKYWDYVLWLWREVLANIDELIFNSRDLEVLFPGQSLYLFMKHQKNYLLVGVKDANHIFEQVLIPKKEFLLAFINNGLDVFNIIHEVNQTDNNSSIINKCKNYLAKLNN